MADREMAGAFVAALAGNPNAPCTFQTFDDKKTKRPELAKIVHGTLDEAFPRLDALNKRGAGVFITVNETDLRGRREDNIKAVRALFVDSDNGDLPPDLPVVDPSMIVRSGHGQHAYWLLEPGAQLSVFPTAQQLLAMTLGTDPKVKDLPRVMRVPGFAHNKADPFPVILEECHPDRRYKIDDVVGAIQPPAPAPAPTPSNYRPPRELGSRVERWMARRDPAIQGKGGDAHTFVTACSLVRDFDVTDEQAMELLLEWNRRCVPPWTEKDLRQKLANARKYARNAPGSKRDEPMRARSSRPPEPPPPAPPLEETTDLGADVPEEPPIPEAPPPSHFQAPMKLKANHLGMMLLRDEKIVRDANDNLYHYVGTHWMPITMARLRSMMLRYESPEETSTRRRTEAANFVCDTTHRDRPILWNQGSPDEIPFQNGMLRLREDGMRPHRPEDYLDRVLPNDYDAGAKCPLWLSLLEDWFGADDDYQTKVRALQEFFGYTLLQHARYKKALILYGDSDTGKSQVAQVIRLMVGNENVCQIGIDKMNDPKQLAPIQGKMVNIVTEIPEDCLVADGGFKQLVSTQEPVQIDEKYKAPIMYLPTAKHVFATNNLPDVDDKTKATFNRLLIIRFNKVIPKELQDRTLNDKLELEIQGITNWALEGARRLTDNAGEFTTVAESETLIDDYRVEQNPIGMFVAAKLAPDAGHRIEFKAICDAFNEWNPGKRPWSSRAIGRALSAMNVRRASINGRRYVLGWAFRGDLSLQ